MMDAGTFFTSDVFEAVTAIATAVGVIFTSVAMTFQIRKATEANRIGTAAVQASIMIKYEDVFRDKAMREARILVSRFLLVNRHLPINDDHIEQWDVVSDLLDFFQGVATYTRSGSLDLETVHKNLFYWLSYYYPPCAEYIRYYQRDAKKPSPIYADDLVWLYSELVTLEAKINQGAYLNHSEDEYDEFFRWEIENMGRYLSLKE